MGKHNGRVANIELVRILAMLGIIIMHIFNPHMFGLLNRVEVQGNWWSTAIIYFFISIFACAVNLFLLITGYFMCESYKRDAAKPTKLLIQVIIFRVALYVAEFIMGAHDLTVSGLVKTLIPANYYVILYIALYWVSPYINIVIDTLECKGLRTCVFLLLIVFSVYPTLVDVAQEIAGSEINGLSSVGAYGSQWGYSIVNFVLMYMIGACIKKQDVFPNNYFKGESIVHLTAALAANTLILTSWAFMNDKTGFLTERSAWEYCNPLLILETVLIFEIFLKIPIKNKVCAKGINVLAKGVFSIFLLHSCCFRFIPVEKLALGNFALLWVQLLTISIVIFLICYVVHCLYSIVMKPIHRVIDGLLGELVLTVPKMVQNK